MSPHQNIRTSTHQHLNINTSTHWHMNSSTRQLINTSTHRHNHQRATYQSISHGICPSESQHINKSTHHINISIHQDISTVICRSTQSTSRQHINPSTHQHSHQHATHELISTTSSTCQLTSSSNTSTHQHSHRTINTVVQISAQSSTQQHINRYRISL
jgi:hypothetical protein